MNKVWNSSRVFIALVSLIAMAYRPEIASFAAAVSLALSGANAWQNVKNGDSK